MTQTEASTAAPAEAAADLLVLPMFEGGKAGPGVKDVSRILGTDLRKTASDQGLEGKLGDTLVLATTGAIAASTVVLTGLGPRGRAGADQVRRATMHAFRAAKGSSVASTLPQVGDDPIASARAYAEGAILAAYRFVAFKSAPDDAQKPLDTVIGLVEGGTRKADHAMTVGRIHAEAANWARDLVNTPAGNMTPALLADAATAMAAEHGLDCTIWTKKDLEKGGFGGILGVGGGSANEPRLIELAYHGGGEEKPIAVTGKGITFDSGGLDLKRSKELQTMKDDMAGAAAALAVMRAVAELGLRINVIAAIGSAENMPGATATRPGDVLTHRGGTTTEVWDTDCEGRLLLADVLSYLSESEPRCIIDSATLTDTGLGEDLWAIFGTDQDLVDDLRAAGEAAGEPGWQLPLWDPYKRHTRSEVADIKNWDWEGADTLSSGLFLRTFAGSTPWAHLDVGNTAFLEDERDEWPVGATGNPVRVILRYLEGRARR